MKPVKLVMSAFGSYGGVEEIDFDKVDRGIFLITGDTGAGKTTVFDAITYALFDETSGGRRDGDMMRSQFADDATPTFVELTFSYGGKEYRVKRNPNYQRISKRKNKDGAYTYTMEAAAVELILPDGTVFPGKSRETNEKIKEILGVDVNQFTQISMIAQGEFLKLLHAPSKERKEIFSRIFDTRIYWQIQNRLKEQSKELYIRLSENLLLMKHELAAVRCPEENMQEEWGQASARVETGKEEILSLLKQMEERQREQEAHLQKQETDCSERLNQVKLQIAQAEEINQKFTQKQETERSIRIIEQKLKELGEKVLEWNGHKKRLEEAMAERLPRLEQQLAEARNLLPKYELLGQRKAETHRLEREKNQAAKQLTETQQQEEKLKKELEELQNSQKELQPLVEQLPGLSQKKKEAMQRKEDIQALCQRSREVEQLGAELAVLREKVSESLRELEERSREYDRSNHIFIAEQAGLLASELTEGSPCPVCGSTHHPHKAKLSGEAVTQEQVEEAKALREQAQARLDGENERFRRQKERYEGEWQVLWNNGQRLLGTEAGSKNAPEESAEMLLKDLTEILKNARKECSTQLEGLEKEQKQLEQKQQQYQLQSQRLEQASLQQTELLERKEGLREQAYEANLSYEKAMQSLQELQENLTYPSKEALEKELSRLIQEKQQMEEKHRTVQESIQTLRQQTAKGEGALEEQKKNLELLISSLEGKQPVDISSFQQREQELMAGKKAAEQERLALLAGKNGNEQARKNLEKLYGEREKLASRYEVAETLSRTANGNLRQQARLDLQTYVQRRYFKHIIGEANRRLVKMSSGRFILQCRELEQLGRQGEAGLDLDVYDLVTDKVRDVKTLSGGESFLAALSMALGMADVIQKNAGKVHLDTMFIDEGFGSLDEEARGRAIRILQELAGETRLVGIISHVTEMKEQMDRKLVITKGEKGSHASWQLES